jgi:hypothetical protein
MTNGKIKVISATFGYIEREVQSFLNTIDVRQIVKMEYTSTDDKFSCLILYRIRRY